VIVSDNTIPGWWNAPLSFAAPSGERLNGNSMRVCHSDIAGQTMYYGRTFGSSARYVGDFEAAPAADA